MSGDPPSLGLESVGIHSWHLGLWVVVMMQSPPAAPYLNIGFISFGVYVHGWVLGVLVGPAVLG